MTGSDRRNVPDRWLAGLVATMQTLGRKPLPPGRLVAFRKHLNRTRADGEQARRENPAEQPADAPQQRELLPIH
jgi:hypothetical protein